MGLVKSAAVDYNMINDIDISDVITSYGERDYNGYKPGFDE